MEFHMNKQLKDATILFFLQLINYTLLVVNYRAVAQAHYFWSAVSDFVIASFSFFVIKKIATSDNTFHGWLGYALGGLFGSILGIWLSKIMLAG
jgi:hypothetical protein